MKSTQNQYKVHVVSINKFYTRARSHAYEYIKAKNTHAVGSSTVLGGDFLGLEKYSVAGKAV